MDVGWHQVTISCKQTIREKSDLLWPFGLSGLTQNSEFLLPFLPESRALLDLFQAPERMPAPEALLPVPKCLNDPLGLLSEPSRSTCLAKFSFFVFTSFSNSILNFKIAYPEGRYAQWANTCLTWANPGCHLQH